MEKQKFNRGWKVSQIDGKILGQQINGFPEGKEITLPHDAMIEEQSQRACPNMTQTAHYPGGYYRYVKEFIAPIEWLEKTVTLEFEGAYMNSRVYLNNDYVGGCHYGYSNFYVNLNHSLMYGKRNRIEVIVNNEILNSRWYTGSGLYRNVWLHTGDPVHIALNGIQISTPDIEQDAAVVLVQPLIKNEDRANHRILIRTEIFDMEGHLVTEENSISLIYGNTEQKLYQRMTVVHPQLWNCENPYLYTCRITLEKDGVQVEQTEQKSGIRKLQLDAVHGLRINGQQVKLRGACIHHDNGIIGACTLEFAEERRCKLLKNAGFNCIRSAHHPISKAMLDACDKYGMLVMDEFSDMWTLPKNINDYANYFEEDWEKDVQNMVEKDFNHPCVVMYSTGNEIQEAGTPGGAELNRRIASKIRSLDETRYVTNGFNGLLAALDYEQKICTDLREKAAREKKELNDIMGAELNVMDDQMIKGMEVHPVMTEKIDAFMGSLDVAGYNYLTLRHEMDREYKPHRVILGTETFPSEIAQLWEIVMRNAHVIGDMTWTGYDYLGEAGLGTISFDGIKEVRLGRTAWCGDIDITGKRRPVSYLREIVYGLRKSPYIAVENPAHFGMKQEKSKWAFEDSLSSWTWRGYEGKTAIVDVYSASEEVELFINGRSLGRKPAGMKNQFTAKFEVIYEPGLLTAKAYYAQEECIHMLQTAGEEIRLRAEKDRDFLKPNGSDIVFITVELCDKDGIVNMQTTKEITIEAGGAGTLQGYGSADPFFEGNYLQNTVKTFEGRVQAAVRAGFEAGEISVKFSADGCDGVEVKIPVKRK